MKRAPSVKRLVGALCINRFEAERLREIIHGVYTDLQVEAAMSSISECIAGSYGIESIWGEEYVGWPIADYVNMGDTYAATILYNYQEGTFSLTTMGDFVERYVAKYGIK